MPEDSDTEEKPASIEFDFDSFKDKNYLTHNYHPYPAKFVPQIPRKVIETLSKSKDLVLDPFCGSGTTLVEACLTDRHSIGVDANPLACLISKVKVTPLTNDQLAEAQRISTQVSKEIATLYYAPLLGHGSRQFETPIFHNSTLWFQPHVLSELAILKSCISRVEDEDLRSFLQVAFSSIIVAVSNQDSDTRYVSVRKKLRKEIVSKLFVTKVQDMIQRMKAFRNARQEVSATVFCGDVSESLPVVGAKVDLIVTSPPFPNTYDYYLYHKFRMIWLDMDYRDAQKKEIGSRHVHSDQKIGIEEYNRKMMDCFSQISRVLKSHGYCCIVIGDAIIRRQYIRMDQVISQIARKTGLRHIRDIHYPLRRYTRTFTPNIKTGQKSGHIMFFKKSE